MLTNDHNLLAVVDSSNRKRSFPLHKASICSHADNKHPFLSSIVKPSDHLIVKLHIKISLNFIWMYNAWNWSLKNKIYQSVIAILEIHNFFSVLFASPNISLKRSADNPVWCLTITIYVISALSFESITLYVYAEYNTIYATTACVSTVVIILVRTNMNAAYLLPMSSLRTSLSLDSFVKPIVISILSAP